ncbi:lantibiotic ABC transporter permease [Streptococcus sp. H49]|uniref:lantibiotic ABC transporter permease n=1 Tax=Streptococcus huangxiaojuni TaxID=3237239 RepID=UPI0034A21BCD
MKKIFSSEAIKLKHSGTMRLVLLIPLITIFIAFLIGGVQIFSSFSIYWWEAGFLFLLISLLFLYDFNAEERAGNFQNINISLLSWNIRVVKIVLLFVRLIFSSLILLILMYIVSKIYQGVIDIDFLKISIALFFILTSVTWDIPLLYILSKWINSYVLLATNTLLCLLVAPIFAKTSFWFIFPYSYHYRVAETLLQIKPSGDMMVSTSNNIIIGTALPVILSLILFTFGLKSLKE